MNVPQHVINKIIAINKAANTIKSHQREVVQWFEKNGVDTSSLSNEYSVLEMAEYGELPSYDPVDIEKLVSENIESMMETEGINHEI